MEEADLHALDAELRAIRLDDGPRLQPLRLDKMFLRARQWSGPATIDHSEDNDRPPSPPKEPKIYPLPRAVPDPSIGPSPLAQLFRYQELIPLVLDNFDKPKDLAVICSVCQEWNRIGRKRLYEHVWIRPWENVPQIKLLLLFETLHQRPKLCRLIRRLEVRFFPLATRGEERTELDDHVHEALSNMQNLESLVWTRDKSLNPALLEIISQLPCIRSLELSGHSYRYYDPSLLGTMATLEDLRIMMPDPHLKSKLVGVVSGMDRRKAGGLKGLSIICQNSSLIDDLITKLMAPHLKNLRRLMFWGCSRITREGVFAVLEEAGQVLEELSLDALPNSNLFNFTTSPPLPSLKSFSLSMTIPLREETPHILSVFDLPCLPHCPSLRELHLTISSSKPELPAETWAAFQTQLPLGLRNLSLTNLVITSASTLSIMLEANPGLEELYLSISDPAILVDNADLVTPSLQIFHVNFTAPSHAQSRGTVAAFLTTLAVKMKGLKQIGSANMVFEVHRRLNEDGETEVELCRWSKTYVPGYFRVWRA